MNKEQRIEYVRENAPTLHAAFQELDIAQELADSYFKNKHGIFWKLKTTKEQRHNKMIKIASKRKVEEYTREFALKQEGVKE